MAEALRPANLSDRPAGQPTFPEPPPKAGGPSTARTLPDRFCVRVEQDGAEPVTRFTRAIPDEVPVGLTDVTKLDALALDDDDLPPLDVTLRWLVDYKEAVELGLAVTVPLEVPEQDIDRVVVYGVRAGLDPKQSASQLEQLLWAHRFDDGAEFVPQGTPTNNTDSVRSAWSRRTPPGAPALDPPFLPAGANAAVTASALGLGTGVIGTLTHAGGSEQVRAGAFNEALWETTWADAIEMLTPEGRANGDKRLESRMLDAIHDHWVGHVRGRGPLPALRLGRQPYGLLPLMSTGSDYKPVRGDRAETKIVPYVSAHRFLWEDAAASVPTVMNQPLDEAIPKILGTDAVLRGLRVRTALSPVPVMSTLIGQIEGLSSDAPGQQAISAAAAIVAGVGNEALENNLLTGKATRTLALPLVAPSDVVFIENLLEQTPRPAAQESVLQVLLAHADAVSRHSLDGTVDPEIRGDLLRSAVIETVTDVDREMVVAGLEAVQEERFDDGLLLDAARHIDDRIGRLDYRAVADRHPLPALAPPTTLQQVAGSSLSFDRLRQPDGMRVVGELFRAAARRAEFQQALRIIASIAAEDDRRLLLAETLDCCSHRLDAWITSAASRRLADLRSRQPEGCLLGAYGVIEHIRLRPAVDGGLVDGRPVLHDPGDGGFVHAPGLTHAATAGVLRSGRLTHRRDDPDSEALDIDLSSGRTRDALSLLDGMRRGQTLGALLGYRLERRLHDESGGALELDRFIYVLRTLAPLRAGKLTDPGQPVEEGLAASDVVDGLRLMERPTASITAKLTTGPDDTRYIDAWVPPRLGEAEAVLAAIADLERTHDAVADLLLAESVHQLVNGNPARAAAALDVLGAGEAVPPDPEVVRQGRTGVTLSHRLAVVIPAAPAPGNGWAASARATAEPRLEAWAREALGDASLLRLAEGDGRTLADAGLSALDVLFDSDTDDVGTSTLARRLRLALPDLGDDLTPLAVTWEIAGLLRGLVAGGRPLDVADTGHPVDPDDPGRVLDAVEIVDRAAAARAALLGARDAAEPTAALLAFGIRPPHPAGPDLTADERALADAALVDEAGRRLAEADRLLARAADPAASAKVVVELAKQALTAVFGVGFVAIPLLQPAAGDVLVEAVGPDGVTARAGTDIRPWLVRAGRLRTPTAAYGEALLVREAYGSTAALRVIQSPPTAYATWVGLPFPDGKPPMVPIDSIVAEVVGGAGADIGGAIAGLVVDEWNEVVPRRLERGDPAQPEADPTLVDVATTGLAVHANGPGSRPAQAILLAMTPDAGRWTTDRLLDVIDEAFALARLRGVTLDKIPFVGRFLPALYFRDWSLQGEPAIRWDLLADSFDAKNAVTHLKLAQ